MQNEFEFSGSEKESAILSYLTVRKPYKLVIVSGIDRFAYYYNKLEYALFMYEVYKDFPDVDDIYFDNSIGG